MAWTFFLTFIISIPATIFFLAGIIYFTNSSENHLKPEEQGEKIITGFIMFMLSALFMYLMHIVYSSAFSVS